MTAPAARRARGEGVQMATGIMCRMPDKPSEWPKPPRRIPTMPSAECPRCGGPGRVVKAAWTGRGYWRRWTCQIDGKRWSTWTEAG